MMRALQIAGFCLPALLLAGRAAADSTAPELLMDGGRRLVFERNIGSERDFRGKRSFWTKVIDVVAGEAESHDLIRPYGVAIDSRGRMIVSDPGAGGLHIFEFGQQKYKFISHREGKDPLETPQCVAVDQQDNIYVTDSEAGKVFVFGANGKFQRVIGSLRGGEGIFKRPTGIAVDSVAQRIYVSDTWRNKILVLDLQGSVVQTIGKRGTGDGEFNFPTDIRLQGDELVVVDAMNFRIQIFDRAGAFRAAFGQGGDARGDMFRPRGIGMDSEGHVYVADALANDVQVFDRQGRLLYFFGKDAGIGDFALPAGLTIDHKDRIFVVDSDHRRIQVFHYFGADGGGGAQ